MILLITLLFIFVTNLYPVQAVEDTLTSAIQSQYAIVIDRDTNQVLSEKNADERMYPASMTKMMTAIIALEHLTDLSQTITITDEMLNGLKEEDASVAGFKAGDTPTVQDILYGIALPSGADATNAVAYTISGSIEAYVQLMNDKATQIGMTNTHFMNVTGLHDDNHYSTARDMSKLLQYCLQNPTFETIFSTHTYTTSSLTSAPNGIQFTSSLFMAAEVNAYAIPGVIGGKTGFTYPAGHCLAAWEEINGMRLITVVAHADKDLPHSPHIQDTNTITTLLQQNWQKSTVLSTSQELMKIHVTHPFTDDTTISIYPPEDFSYDLENTTSVDIQCTLPKTISAHTYAQNIEGTISVTLDGKLLYSTEIMVKIPAEDNLFNTVALWIQEKI